jgi:hypothetical protein
MPARHKRAGMMNVHRILRAASNRVAFTGGLEARHVKSGKA